MSLEPLKNLYFIKHKHYLSHTIHFLSHTMYGKYKENIVVLRRTTLGNGPEARYRLGAE